MNILLVNLLLICITCLFMLLLSFDTTSPKPTNNIEWISREDRQILEQLDDRLVHVIDQLIVELDSSDANKSTNNNDVIERIERRLYVFPFLCVENHDLHERVVSIIGSVVNNLSY